MKIELDPKLVLKSLLIIICLLFCANIIAVVFRIYVDSGIHSGRTLLFDLNSEKNIPTLYSSLTLMLASLLLLIITYLNRQNSEPYFSWLGLALVFAFLSIDEISIIHERIGMPLRSSLNTSGMLFYAWVIPYAVVVLVFVLLYFKFLTKLPKRSAVLFIVSGAIFVSGALGLELFGGQEAELYGVKGWKYAMLYSVEELLEMVGVAIFIFALCDYMALKFGSVSIMIKQK